MMFQKCYEGDEKVLGWLLLPCGVAQVRWDEKDKLLLKKYK